MKLLTAAGNGNGATIKREQAYDRHQSQDYSVFVYGTFDGATVKLEVSPDEGVNWFDTGLAITAQSVANVEIRAAHVRGVVSGGGGSVAIQMLLK